MERKLAVSMFGQKRLSREGGIEIVAKELCTRMVQNGCTVTCYNRSGHHVSGAEYDNKTEYEGIRQKYVPTIEKKGLLLHLEMFVNEEPENGGGNNDADLPPEREEAPSEYENDGNTATIGYGELKTLGAESRYEEIKMLNGMKDNVLSVGFVLLIP